MTANIELKVIQTWDSKRKILKYWVELLDKCCLVESLEELETYF